MATTMKPKIELDIGLKKLGLDKGLRDVVKGLQGVDKSAEKSIGILGRLRKTLEGIFTRGTGVATGLGLYRLAQKIGGAFESLISSALKFDEQMQNVNSVAQYGSKAFAKLTDSVLHLAEDPRILDMPAALAEGLYTLVSSGYSAADSMLILKEAAMGATAGMSTTAVASDVLSSTLGAYGKTAADATATMNDLFQIVFITKFTFNDLANSLATVTPSAAKLGISIQEVGAAMSAMGRQGTDAETATVQLNGVLTALLKPTDAMTELLASYGYASGEAAIQALGFTGVLNLLNVATGGSAAKAAELFGDVRALRGILQITANDGALYTEGLEGMSHAQDGAGATAKALRQQMKSANYQLRLLHKNVILFFTEGLGGKFTKSIAKATSYVNHFFDSFFRAKRRGLGFSGAIFTGIRSALLKMLSRDTYAKIRPTLDGIQKGFRIIGDVIRAVAPYVVSIIKFFIWWNIVLLKFIATGGLAGIALRALEKRFKPVADVIQAISRAVHLAIEAFVPLVKYLWAVATGTKPLSEGLLKIPRPLLWLAFVLARVVKTLRIFFKTWKDQGFFAALKKIPAQIKAFGNAFAGLVYQITGNKKLNAFIVKLFGDFSTVFRHLTYLLRDLVNGDWAKAWKELNKLANDGKRILGYVLSGLWTLIKKAFDKIPWTAISQVLWTGIQNLFDAIPWGRIAGALWNGAKSAFNFMVDTAVPWLAAQLWNLVLGAWNSINWTTIGDTIWSGVKSAFNFGQKAGTWLSGKGAELIHYLWKLDWNQVGTDVWNGIWSAIQYVGKLGGIGADVGWDLLKPLWTLDWNQIGTDVWNGLWSALQYTGTLGAVGLNVAVELLGDLGEISNDFNSWLKGALGWGDEGKTANLGKVTINASANVNLSTDKDGGGLGDFLSGAWNFATDLPQKVFGALSDIKGWGEAAGKFAADLVANIVGGIITAFSNLTKDQIIGIALAIGEVLAAAALLPEIAIIAPLAIVTAFTAGFVQGFTTEGARRLDAAIGPWVHDHIIRPIKEALGIQSPSTVAMGIAADVVFGLINFINYTSVFTAFQNLGKSIISGIVSGINSMISALYGAVANINSGLAAVHNFLGKPKSPSPTTKKWGASINQGLAAGIWKSMPVLDAAVGGINRRLSYSSGVTSTFAPSTANRRIDPISIPSGVSRRPGQIHHHHQWGRGAISVNGSGNPKAVAREIASIWNAKLDLIDLGTSDL